MVKKSCYVCSRWFDSKTMSKVPSTHVKSIVEYNGTNLVENERACNSCRRKIGRSYEAGQRRLLSSEPVR